VKEAKISEKQTQILEFGYTNDRMLICDGAIRCGKTVFMSIMFVDWIMRNFNNATFAIIGFSIKSVYLNVVSPTLSIDYLRLQYRMNYNRNTNILTITGKDGIKNIVRVFGCINADSYKHIQGSTLSGILFDEVPLLKKSFVQIAIDRTLTVDNAKILFNANPEGERHWFNVEYIQKIDKHNENYGAVRINFMLWDSPIISKQAIADAKIRMSETEYKRKVLGQWCSSTGAIFTNWRDTEFDFDSMWNETVRGGYPRYRRLCAYDLGFSNDETAIVAALFDDNPNSYTFGNLYVGRETYRKGMKTKDIYNAIVKMGIKDEIIYFDVGAGGDRVAAELRDLGIITRKAKKGAGSILSGIQNMQSLQIFIHVKNCPNAIAEFSNYSWRLDPETQEPMNEPQDSWNHIIDCIRMALGSFRVTQFGILENVVNGVFEGRKSRVPVLL